MQTREIIARKRDGQEHPESELHRLVSGYLCGEIKDYQMAAWLMAVYFRGLSSEETATLTRLMWKSGATFPRESREDFWIDKHSTGGVGDKPSLILVPLVTSLCRRLWGPGRVRIPMISGRGLGHSGGTLDKLESVAGFNPKISTERALQLIRENDFFMMGQTADVAPADRLLYSLRDVTATVESLPLIVSSIMSKKLAENLDGLVFDVKCGVGAFMKTEAAARELAQALVRTAEANGVRAVALVTRMEEPLGYKVGNQLEVEECLDFLEGKSREPALFEVTLSLAAWMIQLSSRGEVGIDSARDLCLEELDSGRPVALFRTMFEAQGGDFSGLASARQRLRSECKSFRLPAWQAGFLRSVNALEFGHLLNTLGGGRLTKEQGIDPWVGFEFEKKVGDRVEKGEPVVTAFYRETSNAKEMEDRMRAAIEIGKEAPLARPWVLEVFS